MIIPALITAGILGGMYAWGRGGETEPEGEDRPSRVIPISDIPTSLQTRMQNAFIQLPPQLQAQLPMESWANPAAWQQAAEFLNAMQPGSPQSPELMAIANTLRQLGVQPLPNTGPLPLPPNLETELRSVLSSLPPPFNTALPIPPPSPGLPAPMIDPVNLILLGAQIEAALGQLHPAPSRLRAIASQLSASRSSGVMAFAARPVALPVAQEVMRTYRDLLALRDQFRGLPAAYARKYHRRFM